jgi:hypothetical protein
MNEGPYIQTKWKTLSPIRKMRPGKECSVEAEHSKIMKGKFQYEEGLE